MPSNPNPNTKLTQHSVKWYSAKWEDTHLINCHEFLFMLTILLKSLCAVIPVSGVQKKVHTLSTQFVKEWRKRGKGKSGAGVEDSQATKWKFFDELLFLSDYVNVSAVSTLSNMPHSSVMVYLLSVFIVFIHQRMHTVTDSCTRTHARTHTRTHSRV